MTSRLACGCGHPGCSGRHEPACLCLHEHAGGLVHDQHCPACNGIGQPEPSPTLNLDSTAAPASARPECFEHEPVRAVVDVRLDEEGRPAVLLWWVECRRCGEVLNIPESDTEVVA